ncbi:hypothetical protein H4R18_003710 [Coemansia javaensis]|uniref:Pentatricopeptide repeat-containing protein n=1 Tax=Coemansia javaensis TaxID=2761396 RepID=A0A9W8H7U9_9FUNG|nr:hypothetical protein H4R18_003710 [Coemansia javaensis]
MATTTTRIVARGRARTGRQLFDWLDQSIRSRRPDEAWRCYDQLVQLSRRERDAAPADPDGAVPRRYSGSARAHVGEAHRRILAALSMAGPDRRAPESAEQLMRGVTMFLRESGADGQMLSSRQLVALLNFFARARNADAADAAWQYATLTGLPLDITCYNAYLNALVFAGQLARALDLVREIKRAALQPTAYTHATLIRLYGRSGDQPAARRQFESACRSLPPARTGRDAITNRERDAPGLPYWEDAVDDLRTSAANVYVYNEMLDVYGMNGMVDDMRALFLRLLGQGGHGGALADIGAEAVRRATRARGIRPNAASFHVMIKWHAAYWDLDSAAEYMHLMSRCGIAPTAKTLALLVTAKAALRDVDKCAEIVRLAASRYAVETPAVVARRIEVAARKRDEMAEMVRQAE